MPTVCVDGGILEVQTLLPAFTQMNLPYGISMMYAATSQQRDLTRVRDERMAQARRDGNLTEDATTAALTAYSDANRQYTDAQRAAQQTHHDLNALLGLAQDVKLTLTGEDSDVAIKDESIDEALRALPERRPDLLALKAGYEAQEMRFSRAGG